MCQYVIVLALVQFHDKTVRVMKVCSSFKARNHMKKLPVWLCLSGKYLIYQMVAGFVRAAHCIEQNLSFKMIPNIIHKGGAHQWHMSLNTAYFLMFLMF